MAEKATNNEISNPVQAFLSISKASFFIAFAILLGVVAYVVFTNPDINYKEKEHRAKIEKELAEERGNELKHWKYDEYSDVDVRSEKYPIVVLRSGFKVIRIDPETALIGWKYEMINTSPKTKYTAKINYKLTDEDGFLIGENRSESIIQPDGYAVATGTLTIPNADLTRLSDSSWSIGLSPDWEQKEKTTKEKRYQRLTKILQKDTPSWVKEVAKKKFLVIVSEKWAEINKAIIPKEEEKGQKETPTQKNE